MNKRYPDSLLKRGVVEVIIEDEMKKMLQSGKVLRLKQGFDPSRPDIHLGHIIGLRKLREFQELGHKVVLVIGDWTAQIGDPSGVSITRPMLSAEEVHKNAQTYLAQFFKIVDEKKTEVRWQSEWYKNWSLSDVMKISSKFTLAQFMAREDFNNRYTSGRPIAIIELLYPMLQAYDSVAIESSVEFGGSDQKFNCLVGRDLQMAMGQKPQQVLLVPLLVGTDGTHKMSKSLNNYIGITEEPREMYGKVMSIPDNLILSYFELITDISDEKLSEMKYQLETKSVNPMLLKQSLARDIVGQFHSKEQALLAEENFSKVFQKKELPDTMLEYKLPDNPVNIIDVLQESGVAKSRADARRLIEQGAVDINDVKLNGKDTNLFPQSGCIIKVGKRRFIKIL